MPDFRVPTVLRLRVDTVQLSHQSRPVAFTCEQYQVVVVAHQAIGQALRIEAAQGLAQDTEELRAVPVVLVDRLTPITTRGDMVNGAGELDAQGAGHGGNIGAREGNGRPDPACMTLPAQPSCFSYSYIFPIACTILQHLRLLFCSGANVYALTITVSFTIFRR